MLKLSAIYLSPLTLEDILNIGQRPKVEEYDEQLFVIMSIPVEINGSIAIEQILIFLGDCIFNFH